MAKVEMYSTGWCPFCVRAKSLFNGKGVAFDDVDVDRDPQQRQEMMRRGGAHTVPQIFINDQPLGGCDELFALEHKGELDRLLAQDDGENNG